MKSLVFKPWVHVIGPPIVIEELKKRRFFVDTFPVTLYTRDGRKLGFKSDDEVKLYRKNKKIPILDLMSGDSIEYAGEELKVSRLEYNDQMRIL